MIAEYTVKRNGRWYKSGDEIPDIVSGEKSSGGYTKTEINRHLPLNMGLRVQEKSAERN